MNERFETSEWPQILDISSRDRYTKKHGGVIWKITNVDFKVNRICLESLSTEEHIEIEEWNGTGQEFQEIFSQIE